ncbi:D-alanyl-D-alanine carboxypeptidase [Methylobacterium radiotolerans]|uniref:D-alanyl-D-alanine carboxypeptidase family protein n=1 Tax=Methylobacterium TaxID=407 RepID=UPI0004BBB83F|nr:MULTISPECIES: D-alanyl-D-alanine carboxypeptidase family protein [Methylobacterium]KIU36264.1 D-alanyl-D-alanine carboxypeptidase [Methylobacterium radiotolerans]MBN6824544.1 D-alanyl-D-alanine carboxypeptidase [Methylobacterium organophilum]MDE3748551.1 D-alanyl-D-alanine carboxypeptidase [Methylobacterium radiotolerans]OXE41093.1 D-alanyl-D-alanine carboxypeptidase [Methylobacterium radiotolerans]UIY43693.1 D-alanyl-D-alanine carboxypeptidase [Methylobacterium radiotolerans]
MRRPLLTLLAAACALGAGLAAAAAQSFQTAAPHAILIDADSGSVLFEKAADERFSPASMAKLMTTDIVFEALKSGRLSMDTEFTVTEDAWKRGGAGGGGSSMFAQVNSRIKMADLLRGLIVQSGNDAAITIAENMAGSEEAFAGLMNQRAKEIGLTNSTFRNATGYSAPDQKVTARDMAKLALHIIDTYPDYYKIFSEKEFTWNKIRQQNRNPLLALDIGADGLKTGYLEESGYALTGSAVQNGQRLVLVVSGLKTARDRASESRKLMEWGFRAFEPRQVFAPGETVAEASVFGGQSGSVPLVAKKPVRVLLPRGSSDRVSARAIYTGPLIAPVEEGQRVGILRVQRGDTVALDQPLFAGAAVEPGTLSQRAMDAALEFGTGLVRKAFDRAGKGGDKGGDKGAGADKGAAGAANPS